MSSPWIARILLTLLGVQAGVCVAFLADIWTPLQQAEEATFRNILDTNGNLGHILDPSAPVDRKRVTRPLITGASANYLRIDITEDKERPWESFPQGPNEWAVLLNEARGDPPGVVAIDHPLTWEGEPGVMLMNLDDKLAKYDRTVLCVDLRRSPVGEPLPAYLRPSAIPLDRLSNKSSALPRVNQVVFPPSTTSAPNILFGFRILENEETADELPPAFARWDDVLIPSFPIALAMAQHNVSPEEVQITLGSHVRLGNGPIIPLDEFGRILLPHDAQGHLLLAPPSQRTMSYATAEDVIDGEIDLNFLSVHSPDTTLFTKASGTAAAPWGDPTALMNIATVIDSFPRPGPAKDHPRFPLWLETALFLLIAGIGAACLHFRPLARHLLFPLLTLTILAVLMVLLQKQGTWSPFTPILACGLTTWALSTYLSRPQFLDPHF